MCTAGFWHIVQLSRSPQLRTRMVSVRRAGDNTATPIQITNSGQGAKRRPTGWWLPETHVSGNGDGTETPWLCKSTDQRSSQRRDEEGNQEEYSLEGCDLDRDQHRESTIGTRQVACRSQENRPS